MVTANMYGVLVKDLRAAPCDDDHRPARSVRSQCPGQEPAAMIARLVAILGLRMMVWEVPRWVLMFVGFLSSLGS